jgi:hypothetical protein
MLFCSQKILLMILEELSSDEAISRSLSPDRLYCGVMGDCIITKHNMFFLVMMGHNITLKIAHNVKCRPVLFNSTLHFGRALNYSLHVTLVILTSI